MGSSNFLSSRPVDDSLSRCSSWDCGDKTGSQEATGRTHRGNFRALALTNKHWPASARLTDKQPGERIGQCQPRRQNFWHQKPWSHAAADQHCAPRAHRLRLYGTPRPRRRCCIWIFARDLESARSITTSLRDEPAIALRGRTLAAPLLAPSPLVMEGHRQKPGNQRGRRR